MLESGCVLMPFHHLHNEENVKIFNAHDSDPEWLNRPRPEGRYKSIVWIPGNFLSEGILFVNSGIYRLNPDNKQLYETAVVSFQVTENNAPSLARGGWTGLMTGAVRPLFKWQTEVALHENDISSEPI